MAVRQHRSEERGEEVYVFEESRSVERNGDMDVSDASGEGANVVIDEVIRMRDSLSREERYREYYS